MSERGWSPLSPANFIFLVEELLRTCRKMATGFFASVDEACTHLRVTASKHAGRNWSTPNSCGRTYNAILWGLFHPPGEPPSLDQIFDDLKPTAPSLNDVLQKPGTLEDLAARVMPAGRLSESEATLSLRWMTFFDSRAGRKARGSDGSRTTGQHKTESQKRAEPKRVDIPSVPELRKQPTYNLRRLLADALGMPREVMKKSPVNKKDALALLAGLRIKQHGWEYARVFRLNSQSDLGCLDEALNKAAEQVGAEVVEGWCLFE